jgi:predicted DNA-binding transcriptional regulator YafY
MNRIDRLHAILTHLQSKKRVTAQEIANRFKISLRTVYRDIKALDESGVPVLGEAGTGYTIMEGYRLPPVMFTQEEATALLVAGKLAENLTDASIRKQFDSALFKIKAVLRGDDKEHLDSLNNHIAVLHSIKPDESNDHRHLVALQKAIVEKRVLRIDYLAQYEDKKTSRDIEPIGLCFYASHWHLIAYCLLRNDYRDFRVSRIEKLQPTAALFKQKQHRSLQEYINSMSRENGLQHISLSFDKRIARFIGEQKYYFGFVREENRSNEVIMHFLTSPEALNGFGRWLLMYTDAVRILTPGPLDAEMKKLKAELKSLYL